MNDRLKTKFSGDRLFFISYGIMLTLSLLSQSFYYKYFDNYPFMIIQFICIAMLAAYEYVNGGLEREQWVGFAICAGMCIIATRITWGSNVQRLAALMFLYTFCARRIPFPKIADITLKISFVTMAVIVFSGYLGIIDNVVAHKSGRLRQYLGFSYTLYPPAVMLNMTALYIYLRKSRITISAALFWAVLNWYVYHLTDSRISFVLAELLLVAALLMRWLPKVVEKVQALWALMASSFAVCAVGSLVMTIIYNSKIPWMRRLNSAMEGRLNLGKRSLTEHGVNFFGQRIKWIGNGLNVDGFLDEGVYNYVDCMYVKILQRFGIVFAVVLFVLLTWSMYRLWKRKEYHILLISASVAAHCVIDDLSFSMHYNTFWIAMGVALLAPSMLQWDGKTNQIPPPDQSTQ